MPTLILIVVIFEKLNFSLYKRKIYKQKYRQNSPTVLNINIISYSRIQQDKTTSTKMTKWKSFSDSDETLKNEKKTYESKETKVIDDYYHCGTHYLFDTIWVTDSIVYTKRLCSGIWWRLRLSIFIFGDVYIQTQDDENRNNKIPHSLKDILIWLWSTYRID